MEIFRCHLSIDFYLFAGCFGRRDVILGGNNFLASSLVMSS
jgi:hypothetical protein